MKFVQTVVCAKFDIFVSFLSLKALPKLSAPNCSKCIISWICIQINMKIVQICPNLLFVGNFNVCWNFNLPLAPWYGWFFERMIKAIKVIIKKQLEKQKLTYDHSFKNSLTRTKYYSVFCIQWGKRIKKNSLFAIYCDFMPHKIRRHSSKKLRQANESSLLKH